MGSAALRRKASAIAVALPLRPRKGSKEATMATSEHQDTVVEDSGLVDPEDEAEAFYEARRTEVLELLRGNGQAKLTARGDGGVGLLNQGATCYMNSLLQSLFIIPEFRLAVFRFEHDPQKHGDESRCIPLQLQRLFAELQLSVASAVSTKELTASMGFTSSDACQQHDVQELCRVLFDALERSSSLMSKTIRELYSGSATHYIRSRHEAQDGKIHTSCRNESFLDLQVPIEGCQSLEEALRKLVTPEVMDGDNKWFCEELDEKVEALKGFTVERLPQILCLQLLRFVFDLQTMRRKKLSEEVSIPLSVDLAFLMATEDGGHCSDTSDCRYELAAVCLQYGTAHGGHYKALIREAGTGVWRDANDASVSVLGDEKCANLFKPVDGEQGSEALRSSDAYFLLYRRAGSAHAPPAPLQDSDVPEALRSAIQLESERLLPLQRAYELHRKLMQITVFAPCAAELSLQRHVSAQLEGLLEKSPDADEVYPDKLCIKLNTSSSRSPGSILKKALAAFAKKAEEESAEEWAWARGLCANAVRARLRSYDPWRGEPGFPLDDENKGLGEQLGLTSAGFSASSANLILEFSQLDGTFRDWQEGRDTILVCRWDAAIGAPSLAQGSLLALRLPPGGQTTEAAQTEIAAPPVAPDKAVVESFEPDAEECQDLFAPETAAPTKRSSEMSPLLGDVRRAAAAAWNIDDAKSLAIVALSGMQAGKELQGDELTLRGWGSQPSDVLCVEVLAETGGDATPQTVQLFEKKRNTAHLQFNHPDRPQYGEEFPPLAISKDAQLSELKGRIAETLALDPAALHLCKSQHTSAMFKDESRSLRQAGLADASSVFVGHGAPCAPNECILKVAIYTYEKGNHKAREAFNFPAQPSSSVRSLREALLEPLLRWARTEPEDNLAFTIDGLTWKRLRVRDGQAGKQFAVLRDEKTLRSALLGIGDGRQVAVQVLDEEEELTPEDMLVLLRPWRVQEGRLHAPTEMVVTKNQTLAAFQERLTERYKGLLQAQQVPVSEEKENQQPAEHEDIGAKEIAGKEPPAEDSLEIVAAPTSGPPLTAKRCETLKWAESRLSPKPGAAPGDKQLAAFKEVRDGVTLVLRSRIAGASGPSESKSEGKGFGKAGPPGPKPGPKAKAGARGPRPGDVCVAGASRQERALVIQVAHEENAATEPIGSLEDSGPTSPSAV
eukprot:TRINITY_DN11275_c0_g1_i1.p1 TRINITY_DN11275_c0_g1~~TRINITY_DN11275_c0_g1_i1.p1  ORF type:complete len:1183 (+),score=292.38 TRINITY_DN11275_c0_g1_i1:28-3576(+)